MRFLVHGLSSGQADAVSTVESHLIIFLSFHDYEMI